MDNIESKDEQLDQEHMKQIIDKCLDQNAHFFDTMAFRDGDITKEEYLKRIKTWKHGSFLHKIIKSVING